MSVLENDLAFVEQTDRRADEHRCVCYTKYYTHLVAPGPIGKRVREMCTPLNPTLEPFDIMKLVYAGGYLFFLFSKTKIVGTRQRRF